MGISRMSDDEAICKAVNGFLHDRFPGGSWTSIAILCNPKMGLHRDIRNMIGRPNHAITLGNFTEVESGWKMGQASHRLK